MRQNQTNIFFPDEPVLIEIITKVNWIRYEKKLHVESQFNLSFHVRIVYFEKTVNELLQINIAVAIQIQDSEKSLTNDSWKLRVLKGI